MGLLWHNLFAHPVCSILHCFTPITRCPVRSVSHAHLATLFHAHRPSCLSQTGPNEQSCPQFRVTCDILLTYFSSQMVRSSLAFTTLIELHPSRIATAFLHTRRIIELNSSFMSHPAATHHPNLLLNIHLQERPSDFMLMMPSYWRPNIPSPHSAIRVATVTTFFKQSPVMPPRRNSPRDQLELTIGM